MFPFDTAANWDHYTRQLIRRIGVQSINVGVQNAGHPGHEVTIVFLEESKNNKRIIRGLTTQTRHCRLQPVRSTPKTTSQAI